MNYFTKLFLINDIGKIKERIERKESKKLVKDIIWKVISMVHLIL